MSTIRFLGIASLLVTICCCHEPASTATVGSGDSTAVDQNGFRSIFDGKSFQGWQGDTSVWRIDSSCFIGEVTAAKQIKTNSFLMWRGGNPADFEFKAEYRISPGGNSGVNYRSTEVIDVPYGLKGYQADIDGANQYTGQNYEERGRGFLAMRGQKVILEPNKKPVVTDSLGNSDALKSSIKAGWNEVHIIAKGNRMKHYINDILMSDATDNDTANRAFSGVLGLQVHVLPSMKVEYRNIRFKGE